MDIVVGAGGRAGLRVVEAARPAAACVMAAVGAALTDAPGMAAVASRDSGLEVLAALAQAARDGAPLVLVTDGAVGGGIELVAKASLAVSAEGAAHWSAHACQLALTDPRGPVHLAVTAPTAEARAVPVATAVRPAGLAAPESRLLDRAAELLARAQRPILVAGRQCRTLDTAAWLRALAEALPAPVLTTTAGKGALPDPHPLNFGLARGSASGSDIVQAADLAVLVGVEEGELEPVAPSAALPRIRLAASRPEGTEAPCSLEVIGEVALLIAELAPRLRGQARADWDVAELDRLKRGLMRRRVGASDSMDAGAVASAVRDATVPGTIAVIAADGDTEPVLAAWRVVGPRELVVPAPPGLAGFAVPAAVGAAIARAPARVVCFASPHQLLASRESLALAGSWMLPVVVLVVGEVRDVPGRQLTELAASAAWSWQQARDDFGLRTAVERALSEVGPALIDARRLSA